MVSCLSKKHLISYHFVNQSMLLGDSSGPHTFTQVPQRLRFSQSIKRIASNGFDQLKDFDSGLAIRRNPKMQILQEIAIEDQYAIGRIHRNPDLAANASTDKSSPSPSFKRLSAPKRRSALAGDLKRCAVSWSPSHSSKGSITIDSVPRRDTTTGSRVDTVLSQTSAK
jgi:hypothetical protein